MDNLSLFDKTFSLSKITAYSLAMEIDYKHLAYTIIDNIRRRFVALVSHSFDTPATDETFLEVVGETIKKDPYLQKQYKEVNFIYPSDKFMLMPEKYFERKKLKFYFEIDNELKDGEEIQFNYIPDIKSYLLFGISSDITNYFVNTFPIINFYHQGIPLLNHYLKLSSAASKPVIVIRILRQFLMDILAVNEGKVLFYNIFRCQGQEQALYDIFKVINDFGLDSNIEFIGEIDENDDIFKELSLREVNVRFAGVPKGFSFEFENKVPVHKFASLFYLFS